METFVLEYLPDTDADVTSSEGSVTQIKESIKAKTAPDVSVLTDQSGSFLTSPVGVDYRKQIVLGRYSRYGGRSRKTGTFPAWMAAPQTLSTFHHIS